MLHSMGSPIEEHFKQRRMPYGSRGPSRRIKMHTLEDFEFNPGWRSPKQVAASMHLDDLLYRSKWRVLSIRLNRYFRQGLLERKPRSRGYEYSLTEKGEYRLLFFWRKFDYGLSKNSPNYKEQWFLMDDRNTKILNRHLDILIRKKAELDRQS